MNALGAPGKIELQKRYLQLLRYFRKDKDKIRKDKDKIRKDKDKIRKDKDKIRKGKDKIRKDKNYFEIRSGKC